MEAAPPTIKSTEHVERLSKSAADAGYFTGILSRYNLGGMGCSAGDALKTNITTLGRPVLPMSEQLIFFLF
ncbi:hypothetical protein Dsin_000897 [Dipteronia sinensis]|uniref:Uncharacterized protein n=1 Tax=Dipteronia sinensis TaxID=43782 RepID=A0AAE0B2U3_9ROSI|nr:hypothetical protein Dsin_000897 [Dipteronia sinensis]